jgi:molecular chaperone GrpE
MSRLRVPMPGRPTRQAPAWSPPVGEARLEVIEEDTRELLRQLAAARQDAAEAATRGRSELRNVLLAVADASDAFARVFAHMESSGEALDPATEGWAANFRTAARMLERTLTERGVAAIPDVGSAFDADVHEAVEVVDDTQHEDGAIVAAYKTGYLWEGDLLRRAEVVVARNPTTQGAA